MLLSSSIRPAPFAQIYVWDACEGTLKGMIDGRKDLRVGRGQDAARTAKSAAKSAAFTSLCYSADGRCVLAGGNSRYCCIYELSERMLVRRFSVSNNLSLDAMLAKLNSSKLHAKAGNLASIDADDSDDMDLSDRLSRAAGLPGAKRGPDFSSRSTPPEMKTKCVRFSPTGLQWAACTTEGLAIFTLDDDLVFDPSELDLTITPEACLDCLAVERNYSRALVMALALNERYLIERVLLSTPLDVSLSPPC